VIVLDTNMLDSANFPAGSLLTMLERLAAHHQRPLAVPEMVRIEHLAHHRRDVEEALKTARSALGTLNGAFGTDLGQPLIGLTADDATNLRSQAVAGRFTILPIPPGAAEEALVREANRRPPAERQWRDDKGHRVKARGARDAVIWLTLLEAAKTAEGPIWFFSEDKDFADKDDWHPSLRAEAAEVLGERASHLQLVQGGFPALLKRLAAPADMRDADVELLLRDAAVADAVRNMVAGPLLFFDLSSRLPRGSGVLTSSATTELAFDKRMDRPQAYKVDDVLWVTGRIQWAGHKEYTQIQGGDVITEVTATVPGVVLPSWNASVDFTFTTTVILRLNAADPHQIQGLHVLATSPFVIERPPQVNVSANDTATGSDDGALSQTEEGDRP
jgi:hypothetical protein